MNGLPYRVMVSTPAKWDRQKAYPVLYVLDGNENFGTATDIMARHDRLELSAPTIIVGVGYPTDHPGEFNRRRWRDLTISPSKDPKQAGMFGGANAFIRVLNEEVRPLVEANFRLDPERQGIWGYSYGGLTVLRILFRDPRAFATYIAASASIWWGIALWFDTKRGLAISLALNGASFGGIAWAPILLAAIGHVGLEVASLAGSAIMLVVLVPMILAWGSRPPPSKSSRRTNANVSHVTSDSDSGMPWTRVRALHSPAFWSLSGPFALALFAQVGFLVHLVAILEPTIGRASAGLAISIVSVTTVVGRVGLGFVIGALVSGQMLYNFTLDNLRLQTVVAYGLEGRCGGFIRGALVTEEIPGTIDLAQMTHVQDPRLRDRDWVAQVSRQIANITRTLHTARFAHNDLKWRNLLVDGGALPTVYLIDCPSGGYYRGVVLDYRIVKDLACLDKLARHWLSRSQRLRFYLDYARPSRVTDEDRKRIGRIVRFFHGRE